ncbi:unnamed protein product [Porites lobata]|uniref:Protein kinase domain-containing protein n=1 Tax=Porites lobata TaxID=104759 RepID=A0ABN8R8I8_9CNID|nr:unnamed protein product [Porites lobata]
MSVFSRLPYSQREIRPLDKWQILPEQIEIEEELGREAFGVVYKATFRKRVGMEVFDAEITKRTLLSDKKPPQVVAVKDDPSDAQKEELTFEIEQMKLLGSHKNIVSLVGWYTLKDQNFLVVEYVPFGDLLTWLRCRRKEELLAVTDELVSISDNRQITCSFSFLSLAQEKNFTKEQVKEAEKTQTNREIVLKDNSEDEKFKVTEKEFLSSPSASPGTASQAFNSAMSLSIENLKESDEVLCEEEKSFSTEQLFSFALQIAKGMNHLAENRFVHRDLAARNVLVGHGNQVKVADFGLMRQIYEDVYSSGKSKKLPVKWMAPESLYQGLYTTKSDVRAYGVLLWEMSTLGGVPYPTLTNTELYRLLGTGYRMERPDMCSDDVYELMTDCWKEEPCSRPSFFQLIEKLEVIMQRDAPYLDLDKHNEDHPYYNVPPEASGDEEGNMEKEESQDATSIDSYL